MNTPRLLFVDDDRLIIATMVKGLKTAGYNVHSASSGEAALQLASHLEFDLAILDIRMPGLSGVETARLLRDRYDLPTLFLSAYSESELVDSATAEGALGYLVKPIDIVQLIPAIEAALARAHDLKTLSACRSQLEKALSCRRETSIAIGILMERHGLTKQEAFDRIRRDARNTRRSVSEVSRELVVDEEQSDVA